MVTMTNVQLARNSAASHATRVGRARLRRRIHNRPPGESSHSHQVSMRVCGQVLGERHACLRDVLVWDVLLWCWRMCKPEVHSVLRYAEIHDLYRTVGQLTDRQIVRLCAVLNDRDLIR